MCKERRSGDGQILELKQDLTSHTSLIQELSGHVFETGRRLEDLERSHLNHQQAVSTKITDIQATLEVHAQLREKTREESTKFREGITKKVDNIDVSIEPILEGVHSIEESLKVFKWIKEIVKWLTAVSLSVFAIYEATAHIFDKNG